MIKLTVIILTLFLLSTCTKKEDEVVSYQRCEIVNNKIICKYKSKELIA